MDRTERQITKIARTVSRLTVQMMKADGIGSAEFDLIHLVRHHPGITQTQIREQLKIDKGAAARRVANLESKGYLIRKINPEDKRCQLLYSTEKAESLKNSKAEIETFFYEWLLEDLSEEEQSTFCNTLNKLYLKSKKQRKKDFSDVRQRIEERKENICETEHK